MKTYRYGTTTDVPAFALYDAVADPEVWTQWDDGLEWVRRTGPAVEGATFHLKPKGGPVVRLTVLAAQDGQRFADVAHLPLARMTTEHLFEEQDGRTHISLMISVAGPLAFLWDRLVARKQAQEAAQQTDALIAFAKKRRPDVRA